jgi:hypothetical protein
MSEAGSISERRQRVLAKMVLDPAFERRVRDEPAVVADEESVDEAFVRTLAAISPQRVREFRASQRHKDEVRAGKQRKRLP